MPTSTATTDPRVLRFLYRRLLRYTETFCHVSPCRSPVHVLAELEHCDQRSFFQPLLPLRHMLTNVMAHCSSTEPLPVIPSAFFQSCRHLVQLAFRNPDLIVSTLRATQQSNPPIGNDGQNYPWVENMHQRGRLIGDAFGVMRWLSRYEALWPHAAPSHTVGSLRGVVKQGRLYASLATDNLVVCLCASRCRSYMLMV
jgi:hypothetical protein